MKTSIDKLISTVVDGGYCIGCGACASLAGSPMEIKMNSLGLYQAQISESARPQEPDDSLTAVCPFSDDALNESQIGNELFSKDCESHPLIGYHRANYAGFVKEGLYREKGSSGGMGSWIIQALLSRGMVDGVLHVKQKTPTPSDPRLFEYALSTTSEEIVLRAKSRYYPIEMSGIMRLIRERAGRYAIVGIPCFIKAVRLLQKQDLVLKDRIVFCVGLICGHLKSENYARAVAWQCGMDPAGLSSIDFRKKLAGLPANKYGVEVAGTKDGQPVSVIRPTSELFGNDWGLGFFKYKACDFCDDVLAEAADVTVGDAWLPQYVEDSNGTNVVTVRNPQIHRMIEEGIASGALALEKISPEAVAQSQAGGFRHRRDGLAYRLSLLKKKVWYPPKRVQPNKSQINGQQKKVQRMRSVISASSHIAFQAALAAGKWSVFQESMSPLLRKYSAARYSLFRRLRERVRRWF